MRANNYTYGLVAEWPRCGLQIHPRGFDSLPDLQQNLDGIARCGDFKSQQSHQTIGKYLMRLIDLFLTEAELDELEFMGSTCTKDCSGHKAGYKWSLDRAGRQPSPLSPSPSFNKGAAIAAKTRTARPQGGGKFANYLSNTPDAVRKRTQRAQAKAPPAASTNP